MSNKMFEDVSEFIRSCEQERSETNQKLYLKLIDEEYKELKTAEEENNELEKLDACMDMIWVILGYCYMKGWDVSGAWNEVARSNLEKIDPITNKVKKREDGKILKPEGWTPPDLERYLGETNAE